MILSSQTSLELKLGDDWRSLNAIKRDNGILNDADMKNEIFDKHDIAEQDRENYVIYESVYDNQYVLSNKAVIYLLTDHNYAWMYSKYDGQYDSPDVKAADELVLNSFKNFGGTEDGFPIHVISKYPLYVSNRRYMVSRVLKVHNYKHDYYGTNLILDKHHDLELKYEHNVFQINNHEPHQLITVEDVFPKFATKRSLISLNLYMKHTLKYAIKK
jgi:hypothetical protein